MLDQSIGQQIVSIHLSAHRFEPEPQHLVPLLRAIYSDLKIELIYMGADGQTAAERLVERNVGNKSRFDGLRLSEFESTFEQMQRLVDAVQEAYALAGIRTHQVDASEDLETVFKNVRTIIFGFSQRAVLSVPSD